MEYYTIDLSTQPPSFHAWIQLVKIPDSIQANQMLVCLQQYGTQMLMTRTTRVSLGRGMEVIAVEIAKFSTQKLCKNTVRNPFSTTQFFKILTINNKYSYHPPIVAIGIVRINYETSKKIQIPLAW